MHPVTHRASSQSFGYLFLVLFSLPFIGVGAGALYFALWPVYRSLQAEQWPTVPALIESADVQISSSSKGSSTYKLVARFSYEVNGQRYHSDSVSFYTGSDSMQSFHYDRLSELSPFVQSTSPFSARVNPSDPNDAVLFPTIRWSMTAMIAIFGIVFAVAGLGIFALGIALSRSGRDEEQRSFQSPGQPWMHRREWAERRVRCGNVAGLVFMGVITVIWNGISAFVPVAIYTEYRSGDFEWIMLLFLLFPLIGLGLLWGWFVMLMRWRRFGSSELTWDRNPLRLGEDLRGTLIAPRNLLDAAQAIEVTLACQEHLTSGSGKNRSTRVTTLVETKFTVPLSPTMGRDREAHVPLKLTIPAQGTLTQNDGNPRFSWKLTANASIPGADYSAEFELPVFEGAKPEVG